MPDDTRWGPATTYRSSPRLRRPAPAVDRRSSGRPPEPSRPGGGRSGASRNPGQRQGSGQGLRGGQRPAPTSRGGSQRPVARAVPRRPSSAQRRRRTGTVLLLVVLLVIAYPVSLGLVAWSSLSRVGPMAASTVPDSPGRTVLLVGSDSREGLSADQEVTLSTGPGAEITGARTDTIMLLHTPPLGGPSVLVSLPRDSYVAIPGHDSQKINAAFAIGGPELLEATVEQATGIHLDGYAETGLAGFAGMVDAVGGVTMCPADAIVDPKAGLDIPAGCQEMDGPTALGYARSRDSAVGGDLGRAQRQREIIAGIATEGARPSTLLNPFTAYPLAKAGGGALSVDDGTGPVGLARFATTFRSVASGSAVSLTVPVASADRSTDAGLVVDWDQAQSTALFDAIRTNDSAAIEAIAAAQPNLEGSSVG